MRQEATEHGLPPTEDPTECFSAGTGCVGKLLWSRAGSPGQHLGGTDATKRGNRCERTKAE